MDYQAEQEMEMEALQSILMDDLQGKQLKLSSTDVCMSLTMKVSGASACTTCGRRNDGLQQIVHALTNILTSS